MEYDLIAQVAADYGLDYAEVEEIHEQYPGLEDFHDALAKIVLDKIYQHGRKLHGR